MAFLRFVLDGLAVLGEALSGHRDLPRRREPPNGVVKPPPGHPETLRPDLPPSRVERAIWRELRLRN
jgi:hypothetical protein